MNMNIVKNGFLHLAFFIFCVPLISNAQIKLQTIKGTVKDKTTKSPLAFATVNVEKSEKQIGTVTDENGNFILKGVPVGRQSIRCTYLGYATFLSEEFILTSAKETVINVELQEEIQSLAAVEVVASQNTNAPVNESALVSTRSFSAEETERMPAGVNDLGRMAISYPGVTRGGDDTENDIIIRGNSSFGMLWRLEGIDIPNPNHFARPGTSGGGVTVFSAQLLSRSDFSTGGMSAEYGNALSGTFDVHFRKGNMEKREHRVKIGLLGLDFATEGPIKSQQASYLINYRYSTLGLL
ncbi:MAG: carboxypeptidase-like regulatory domain-containing protein, partial [Saprospiraceae bacterium]